MTEFPANPQRLDPYKNFKFRVKWDGVYVAGISEVTALRRTTEVLRFREGGDPSTSHKSPGVTEYDPIKLSRGVTQDTAFEAWAEKVWMLNGNPEVSLKDFRKDLILDFFNEAGQVVLAYKIYRCWVSEYEALPVLLANRPAIAIQSIVLQNEGWERDLSVKDQPEPSYTPPTNSGSDPVTLPTSAPQSGATSPSATPTGTLPSSPSGPVTQPTSATAPLSSLNRGPSAGP